MYVFCDVTLLRFLSLLCTLLSMPLAWDLYTSFLQYHDKPVGFLALTGRCSNTLTDEHPGSNTCIACLIEAVVNNWLAESLFLIFEVS